MAPTNVSILELSSEHFISPPSNDVWYAIPIPNYFWRESVLRSRVLVEIVFVCTSHTFVPTYGDLSKRGNDNGSSWECLRRQIGPIVFEKVFNNMPYSVLNKHRLTSQKLMLINFGSSIFKDHFDFQRIDEPALKMIRGSDDPISKMALMVWRILLYVPNLLLLRRRRSARSVHGAQQVRQPVANGRSSYLALLHCNFHFIIGKDLI